MFKSSSRINLEGEFQCKISLLDDTELSCDFKVREHESFHSMILCIRWRSILIIIPRHLVYRWFQNFCNRSISCDTFVVCILLFMYVKLLRTRLSLHGFKFSNSLYPKTIDSDHNKVITHFVNITYRSDVRLKVILTNITTPLFEIEKSII